MAHDQGRSEAALVIRLRGLALAGAVVVAGGLGQALGTVNAQADSRRSIFSRVADSSAGRW